VQLVVGRLMEFFVFLGAVVVLLVFIMWRSRRAPARVRMP
jgi:hypothetical protein